MDTPKDSPSSYHRRPGSPKLDRATEKFTSTKRLDASDKRQAAINLGKLAESLDKQKPLNGVKKIIAESKLEGVFEKRKRFFCLPSEEAEAKSRSGTYNADPKKFITLAKAAGRLLSNSTERKPQEIEEIKAQRHLLYGTSYRPSNTPQTPSERSIQDLLDEYAARLKEAIVQRTRISELWQALDNSCVDLEYSYEPMAPSIYGPAADCPSELRNSFFLPHIKYAQFTPGDGFSNSWAEPSLLLGHLVYPRQLYALKIPQHVTKLKNLSKIRNFEKEWEFDEDGFDDNETAFKWLKSIGWAIGSDNIECMDKTRLEKINVFVIYKVIIVLRRHINKEFNIEFVIYPSGGREAPHFMMVDDSNNKTISERIKNSVTRSELIDIIEFPDDYRSWDDEKTYEYIDSLEHESEFFRVECEDSHENKTSFLVPKWWSMFKEYWVNEDEFQKHEELYHVEGWTDNPVLAKLVVDGRDFVPAIADAKPEAGAAREGSIAAALFENAISAAPEHKISQLLIDQSAIIAESGLGFVDAVIEKTRAALSNI
ncbi:hypothetical protein OAN80_03960 [Alphaproteobacteria bacterium]|nr:hypothetical protein [Alphaproteobacteria bacterium]